MAMLPNSAFQFVFTGAAYCTVAGPVTAAMASAAGASVACVAPMAEMDTV